MSSCWKEPGIMRAYKCSIWPTKWQFPITVGIDDSLILSRTNIWGELKTKKIKWNFLCSQIQNEIIALIGDKVLDEIVRRVKKATFFSIIMDCTPDTSHTEQLSVVLRVVLQAIGWCINLGSFCRIYWCSRHNWKRSVGHTPGEVGQVQLEHCRLP